MTYSKPMGTMYAAAGLGMGPSNISPPFRRYGFRAFDGVGAVTLPEVEIQGDVAKTTLTTRGLQTALKAKGFDPGTVDGVWGSRTSGALMQAAQAAGATLRSADVVGSADKQNVTLPTAVWVAIKGLPDSSQPRAPRTTAPAPTQTDVVPDGDTSAGGRGFPTWIPWAAGAAVLAGVGGYFVYRGRRKRVARNKRRRRRTSRRR